MTLEELKKDCSIKQKKGIHFIIASVIIWIMVLIVQLTNLPVLSKNFFTFCCTALLLPFGWLYNSKTYIALSIIISILSLIVGNNFPNSVLAIMMIIIEIIFSILLFIENKRIS